jgi:hypothetical protein
MDNDKEEETAQESAGIRFSGPVSGPVHTGSGDISIGRIAGDAVVGDKIAGPARVGVSASGDVVVIEPEKPIVVTKLPQQAAYERIAAAANVTREQLAQIYHQDLAGAERWSRFSLSAAVLGFLMVLGGVLAMFAGSTAAGMVTSAAGVIPEVAAALFFQQSREAHKRVNDNRNRLLEAEGMHRAIELLLTADKETQNRLKETIILKALGLPAKGEELPALGLDLE